MVFYINNIGVYIHIPFCNEKCPYCDFYSVNYDNNLEEKYIDSIIREIEKSKKDKADSLYIGGGTPSCINPKRLASVIITAKDKFDIDDFAEITVECNPSNDLKILLPVLSNAGVNRISMGLQSAVFQERKALGRKAKPEDVQKAVELARDTGIENISLDLMLGVPKQTKESLKSSIDFCKSLDIEHISAYILKIEENTPFYKMKNTLELPSEDEVASLYIYACNQLEKSGFNQYEISNFSKNGKESKHNLKYWNCDEYLGFGASAHSFIDGKRFFYSRDLKSYINGSKSVLDGEGGSFEEYLMMRLRLTRGLREEAVKSRFGYGIPFDIKEKAKSMEQYGVIVCDDEGIRLTQKGFLLSNSIISKLI
ncbi:MAG: radical SAM family heme chaperone HemW [Acutalibacteraceae bacterium]